MFLNNVKRMCGVLVLPALILSACNPVKFSTPANDSSSNTTTNPNGPGELTDSSTTLRDVHYNQVVTAADNKLDIVLIIDDSSSMLSDNQKLAANLAGFVSKLQNSNFDWQMCATVTRALPISANQMAWGASIYWQNSDTASSALGMVLKKGATDLPSIFAKTINYINAGWVDSDDERAIKAAYRHVYNGDSRYQPNNGCYRSDSAIAYIIISDEDERSIGGDASQQVYANELKPLEEEDQPSAFITTVKDTFGSTRRFTVNSIIVKPGDTACKSAQDAGGIKSHYGFRYAELSALTAGGVGSICDSDYSTNLNLFLERIQASVSSIPLECQPYKGNITVNISPNAGAIQSKVEGMSLVFSTPVTAGSTIDLKYQCADTRSPSSTGKAAPLAEGGFWVGIVNFLKNLF